jgi:hypothetical protein
MPLDGGIPLQVTRQGGYIAFEAPDGQSVYFYKGCDAHIWQCGLNGDDETTVLDSVFDYRIWSVHSDGIYYLKRNPSDGLLHVYFFDFRTQKIKTLATLGAVALALFPLPSPDRQWIYLTVMEKLPQSDIILVENF